MKQTNLDFLFQNMVIDYADLITIEPQTKDQFIKKFFNTHSLARGENHLFYHSILKSDFETIRLGDNCILFNS